MAKTATEPNTPVTISPASIASHSPAFALDLVLDRGIVAPPSSSPAQRVARGRSTTSSGPGTGHPSGHPLRPAEKPVRAGSQAIGHRPPATPPTTRKNVRIDGGADHSPHRPTGRTRHKQRAGHVPLIAPLLAGANVRCRPCRGTGIPAPPARPAHCPTARPTHPPRHGRQPPSIAFPRPQSRPYARTHGTDVPPR